MNLPSLVQRVCVILKMRYIKCSHTYVHLVNMAQLDLILWFICDLHIEECAVFIGWQKTKFFFLLPFKVM